MKKAGRIKVKCTKCGAQFSTHSSNRDKCHRCLPKCRETHYFFGKKKVKVVEKEKHEETAVAGNKTD
jgi:hypothetical protein